MVPLPTHAHIYSLAFVNSMTLYLLKCMRIHSPQMRWFNSSTISLQ